MLVDQFAEEFGQGVAGGKRLPALECFAALMLAQAVERMDGVFTAALSSGKLRPDPSLRLGFIHRASLARHTVLTVRATTTLGGRLREKSCTADYGDIGGVQTVNCRLAASTLEPAETLRYLFNETPRDRHQISVSLSHAF